MWPRHDQEGYCHSCSQNLVVRIDNCGTNLSNIIDFYYTVIFKSIIMMAKRTDKRLGITISSGDVKRTSIVKRFHFALSVYIQYQNDY